MPLTDKGSEILFNMREQYGKDRGESVFYASANSGRIKGVHSKDALRAKFNDARKRGMTTDEALQAALSPPVPALPTQPKHGVTVSKDEFRRIVRDSLAHGMTVDKAIELGTISGVENPRPMSHSEAPTMDRAQFARMFRDAIGAGMSTQDAIRKVVGDAEPPGIKRDTAGKFTSSGSPAGRIQKSSGPAGEHFRRVQNLVHGRGYTSLTNTEKRQVTEGHGKGINAETIANNIVGRRQPAPPSLQQKVMENQYKNDKRPEHVKQRAYGRDSFSHRLRNMRGKSTADEVLEMFKMPDTSISSSIEPYRAELPTPEETATKAPPAPSMPALPRASLEPGFKGSDPPEPTSSVTGWPESVAKPTMTRSSRDSRTEGDTAPTNVATPGNAGKGSPASPSLPSAAKPSATFRKSFADAIDSGMSTTDALTTALGGVRPPAARQKPPLIRKETVEHYAHPGQSAPDAVPARAPVQPQNMVPRKKPSRVLQALGRA